MGNMAWHGRMATHQISTGAADWRVEAQVGGGLSARGGFHAAKRAGGLRSGFCAAERAGRVATGWRAVRLPDGGTGSRW